MKIELTNQAAKRIMELISSSKTTPIALRVSVDGGGCSGFMYNYELIDKINDDDLIITNGEAKVAIDPVSQEFLKDCVIDFIIDLGSSFFHIINPQATAKCGCGNSFAI